MRSPAEKLFDGGKKGNIIGFAIMLIISIILIFSIPFITNYVKKMGRVKGTVEQYTAGTYTASVKGFGGDITTTVKLSKKDIEDIKVDAKSETPDIGLKAVSKLKKEVLNTQSVDFDAVAGATVSSEAFRLSLKKVLAMGRNDEEELKKIEAEINSSATSDAHSGSTSDAHSGSTKDAHSGSTKDAHSSASKEDAQLSADIVVIGAGGAGMSAAIEAVQNGATNVVILEKMPITGGNTIRATGGINAAETKYQERDNIQDSVELFVEDTMKGGKNLNNKNLVSLMAEKSKDAVEWINSIGGDLSVVGQFGGASVKRIHRPSDTSAIGPALVKILNAKIKELDIPVLLETKATKIGFEDNKVTKVIALDKNNKEIEINTKAVILATGGFGANSDMVVSYNPKLLGFGTTNHNGASGDGINMALELGAALVDIEQIQTHPTVNPNTQTMYTEAVRGNGAILINKEGKRFVNELETRDKVSAAILEQKDNDVYLLFDQSVRDSLAAIEKYIKAGIVVEAKDLSELAKQIDVNEENLKKTIDDYQKYQKSSNDEEFSRKSMESALDKAPYYAALCLPAIHHTMGGVKINENTQVLNKDDQVITGLYAAGEVTGGIHGANRLGGNAVTDIVVFGRIAGANAHKYVLDNGGTTKASIKVVEEENTEVKPQAKGNFKDGKYESSAKGMNGDVKVEFVVEGGNIISIKLKEHNETPGIFEKAQKDVVANIIKKQSLDVDVVAGATKTSNAIINAIKAALK